MLSTKERPLRENSTPALVNSASRQGRSNLMTLKPAISHPSRKSRMLLAYWRNVDSGVNPVAVVLAFPVWVNLEDRELHDPVCIGIDTRGFHVYEGNRPVKLKVLEHFSPPAGQDNDTSRQALSQYGGNCQFRLGARS